MGNSTESTEAATTTNEDTTNESTTAGDTTATTNKRKAEEISKEDVATTEDDKAEDSEPKADADTGTAMEVDEAKIKEETVATPVAAATPGDSGVPEPKEDEEDEDIGTTPGKRRFFPRVKHLLTREWESFLVGVLDALEQSGAPQAAAASHKVSNPWYKAFDLVYSGVAQGCSIPHGKNRYHKFKDKIVELWVAMEQHASDDHPLKARSVDQLEEYKKACANHAATPKKEPGSTPKTPGGLKTPADKILGAAGRRSFASSIALKWKHLNEAEALAGLPEPLQSLIHVRHIAAELSASNKAAIEEPFQTALEEYLKQVPEEKTELFQMSTSLALLYRLSQSEKETKDITDAYERILGLYLVTLDSNTASV